MLLLRRYGLLACVLVLVLAGWRTTAHHELRRAYLRCSYHCLMLLLMLLLMLMLMLDSASASSLDLLKPHFSLLGSLVLHSVLLVRDERRRAGRHAGPVRGRGGRGKSDQRRSL